MTPLFELVLNDEEGGVGCISLVDRPAIEQGWIQFAEQPVKFETVDKEKRILFGPILIPNQAILRLDGEGNPFYVVFSRDTIEKIRNLYLKSKLTDVFNAQHEATIKVNGFMVETFIKDSVRGMMPPKQYSHLADGTWFGSIKIEDDPIWNRFVKTGIFTGFSIEGNFNSKPVIDTEILDRFDNWLSEINTKIKQST